MLQLLLNQPWSQDLNYRNRLKDLIYPELKKTDQQLCFGMILLNTASINFPAIMILKDTDCTAALIEV